MKFCYRFCLWAVLGLGWLFFAAYAHAAPPLFIVTTTAQVGDLVRHVAGDHVRLDIMMGEGVDPHLYRPTRSDMVKLQQADMVFYSGLNLEGKMTDLLEKLAANKLVLAVADDGSGNAHHGIDPHVWMDVERWRAALHKTAAALIKALPQHEAEFTRNLTAYDQELQQLDAYAKQVIASIPAEKRALITAHDAFHYFGQRYGIEVHGIQGISTDSEAGLKQIEELVALIVARNIPAVFAETSVSDRNIKALVEGSAAKNHRLLIGGHLFSDAMGKPLTYEGTYVGMIDHNVTMIGKALGGNVPANGMSGKLTSEAAQP
ncbi:MAG: metal ABC transporter solute-binding protein, Zn/Mn family [Alphaproteobacteria bacterium]